MTALPTEHSEQAALVQRCRYSGYPYELIYANPNAGKRTIGAARYMIAEGLTAGIPDLFLPHMRGGYGGLYIEMKMGRNKLTLEQAVCIDNLRAEGYRVEVCYGQDAAWHVIESYVQGRLVRDMTLKDRILERIR